MAGADVKLRKSQGTRYKQAPNDKQQIQSPTINPRRSDGATNDVTLQQHGPKF